MNLTAHRGEQLLVYHRLRSHLPSWDLQHIMRTRMQRVNPRISSEHGSIQDYRLLLLMKSDGYLRTGARRY